LEAPILRKARTTQRLGSGARLGVAPPLGEEDTLRISTQVLGEYSPAYRIRGHARARRAAVKRRRQEIRGRATGPRD
jgi:hypothetical protein